jgi:hypothetical protein
MDIASKNLENTFRHLAKYYYLCTDGGVLLSRRWDESKYAESVEGCELAVEHARRLNRLWLEAGKPHFCVYLAMVLIFESIDEGDWDEREVERGIEGFPDKLDYFAYGCAI